MPASSTVHAKKLNLILAAGGGWSETLFTVDSNISMDDAITRMNYVAARREDLSWTTADRVGGNVPLNAIQLQYIRVSDEEVLKDTIVVPYTPQRPVSLALGQYGPGNLLPNVAAKIKWFQAATPEVFAVTYLHGLLSGLCGGLPRNAPIPSAYKTWMDAYLAAIQTQRVGFRTQLTTGLGARFVPNAVTYDPLTDKIDIVVPAGMALPTGPAVINLRGFKGPYRQLNGRLPCICNDGAKTITPTRKFVNPLIAWDGFGSVARLIYQYWTPDRYQWNFITTKKLGRPFYLQRGRSTRRAG